MNEINIKFFDSEASLCVFPTVLPFYPSDQQYTLIDYQAGDLIDQYSTYLYIIYHYVHL